MNPIPSSQEGEPQWDEHEMTFLAVELFRQRARLTPAQSNRYPSAAQLLFDNINNDTSYQPDWDQLVLPNGRSAASSRNMFLRFQRHSSVPGSGQPTTAPTIYSYPPPIVPSRKRSHDTTGAPSYSGRVLMPKQASALPTDPGRQLIGHPPPHSPLIDLAPPPSDHPARKKRGRPTNAEKEERRKQTERAQRERDAAAQAQAQAHPSPSVGSPFAVMPSQSVLSTSGERPPETFAPEPQPPGDVTSTPRNASQPEGEAHSSSSGSRKKRGRPPKPLETEPLQQPSFANLQASSAYGSPPQSGVSVGSIGGRRLSVSTRSQAGMTVAPAQQEQGDSPSEDPRQQQSRQRSSWNDTVMGSSNANPRSQ